MVMSRSHKLKGRTTDEAFQTLQEQCFLQERGAPVGADLSTYITHWWKGRERKNIKGLLETYTWGTELLKQLPFFNRLSNERLKCSTQLGFIMLLNLYRDTLTKDTKIRLTVKNGGERNAAAPPALLLQVSSRATGWFQMVDGNLFGLHNFTACQNVHRVRNWILYSARSAVFATRLDGWGSEPDAE